MRWYRSIAIDTLQWERSSSVATFCTVRARHHLMLGIKFRFGGFLLSMVPLCLMIIGILAIRFDNIRELYIVIFMSATSALFLIMGLIIKSRLMRAHLSVESFHNRR